MSKLYHDFFNKTNLKRIQSHICIFYTLNNIFLKRPFLSSKATTQLNKTLFYFLPRKKQELGRYKLTQEWTQWEKKWFPSKNSFIARKRNRVVSELCIWYYYTAILYILYPVSLYTSVCTFVCVCVCMLQGRSYSSKAIRFVWSDTLVVEMVSSSF